MEKYIGIVCSNSKISTALGKILEGTLGTPNEKFRFILDSINILNGNKKDSRNTYLASFSHPLKVIVSMITGIPFELFDDPIKKNNYIININTFEYKEGIASTSPAELYKNKLNNEQCNEWITLNDFVNYFGHMLCKRFINKDVWVRCEEISCNNLTSGNGYRIYSDVRTRSEYEFIKKHDGAIITIDITSKSAKNSCIFDNSLLNETADYRVDISDNNIRSIETLSAIYDIVQSIQKS